VVYFVVDLGYVTEILSLAYTYTVLNKPNSRETKAIDMYGR